MLPHRVRREVGEYFSKEKNTRVQISSWRISQLCKESDELPSRRE